MLKLFWFLVLACFIHCVTCSTLPDHKDKILSNLSKNSCIHVDCRNFSTVHVASPPCIELMNKSPEWVRNQSSKISIINVNTAGHHCRLVERTKKMASNIENTLRRIKDSTQDLGKNVFDHINIGLKNLATKNPITDDDIRQYEQLVIMKKYPYLDIKELEMKYSPLSYKSARHSVNFGFDPNLQSEPGICDSGEDVVNVEIINRGLTGFAIPPQLTKHLGIVEYKLKNSKTDEFIPRNKKHTNANVLTSLNEDINAYMERRRI